jgi:cytochrome c5
MVHLLLRVLPLLLLGAACMTAAKERPPDDASLPAEQRGRAIYETSCNRCHALYMPSSFQAEEWAFYVRKYGRKARLSAQERDLVYAYLAVHARKG